MKYFSIECEAPSGGYGDKAIVKYEQLIEMHPEDSSYYWNLGVAYYRKGDVSKTRKQIKKLKDLGNYEMANELENQLDELVRK